MRLVVKSGVAAGKEFEINRELVAGRAATADIVIGDTGVSSRHARLRPVGDGIEVTDLGSTNGTFVDGNQISGPVVVRPGQALRFSTTELALTPSATDGSSPAAATARLVVLNGADSGKQVPLAAGQEVTIGRAPESGLRLSDTRVSSRHASVRLAGNALEVRDLGSANGTSINGATVTGVGRAVDGSEIRTGDTVISFLASGQAAPPQMATVLGKRDLSDSTIQRRVAAAITERSRKTTMIMSTIGVIAVGGIAFGAWAVLHGGKTTTPTDIGEAVVAKMGPATVRVDVNAPDGNESSGSGSIIDLGNGLVLTNNHVIADGAAQITTIGPTALKNPLPATLVGTAVCDDLTVLKVPGLKGSAPNMLQVTFADSAQLKQGETVVTLGYPADNTSNFNTTLSTTRGVISKTKTAYELNASYPHLQDVIQTDAAINHGNSGGGLFDGDLRQVGVNTLTSTADTNSQYYAISSARVLQLLPGLKSGASPKWIGIRVVQLTSNSTKQPVGIGISDLYPGSAADQAGLLGPDANGDAQTMITKINGKDVSTFDDYCQDVPDSGTVTLTVVDLNTGDTRDVKVKVGETTQAAAKYATNQSPAPAPNNPTPAPNNPTPAPNNPTPAPNGGSAQAILQAILSGTFTFSGGAAGTPQQVKPTQLDTQAGAIGVAGIQTTATPTQSAFWVVFSNANQASSYLAQAEGTLLNPGSTSLQAKCNQTTDNNNQPLLICTALQTGSLVVVEVDVQGSQPDATTVTTDINNALDYAAKAQGS